MGKKRTAAPADAAAQAAVEANQPLANGIAEPARKKSRKQKAPQAELADVAAPQDTAADVTLDAEPVSGKKAKKDKKEKKDKKGKQKAVDNGLPLVQAGSAGFDAELDALFSSAAKAAPPAPRPAPPAPAKAPAATTSAQANGDTEDASGSQASASDEELLEDDEEEDDDDGEALEGEDEDEELEALNRALEEVDDDEDTEEGAAEDEDADSEEEGSAAEGIDELVQASLSNGKGKARAAEKPAKKKVLSKAEQEEQNRRTIFVGNVPVETVKSKTQTKKLMQHIAECLPGLPRAALESIRFRSVPFAVPTGDYTASAASAAEAAALERKNERALAHRQAVAALDAEERGLNPDSVQFLRPSQKRKVAFIKQEINANASSVNAYVTISKDALPPHSPSGEGSSSTSESILPARIIAALLAIATDGSTFMERHLRTDLAVKLTPDEIAQAPALIRRAHEAHLPSSKSDGEHFLTDADRLIESLTTAAPGDTDPKCTVFVGNLDFAAKEEDLRAFFEGLMTGERGPCPASASPALSAAGEPSWVRSVRIVRDRATQLGKGFAYVRFIDEACVDEVMTIHEVEQEFLAQVTGGAGAKNKQKGKGAAVKTTVADAQGKKIDFKRKLKFMKRPIRVSRCKATTKSRHASAARKAVSFAAGSPSVGAVSGSSSPAVGGQNGEQTPRRRRSTGAPTPGGTSPFALQRRGAAAHASSSPVPRLTGSPVGLRNGPRGARTDRPPVVKASAPAPAAVPAVQVQAAAAAAGGSRTSDEYRSLDKATRVALKKGDAERQARRAEKKQRKVLGAKMMKQLDLDAGAAGKGNAADKGRVKLKQPGKKSKPGMGAASRKGKDKKKSSSSSR